MQHSDHNSDFDTHIADGCSALGVVLSPKQIEQLRHYWQLFMKWNASYNLSSVRNPRAIIYKHLLDCLTVVPHLALNPGAERCIDVGTGGGLPGVVLAICFPDKAFTLLDSAGKKMRFLFQVKTALGLDNVELENCRVEAYTPENPFDIVISRAFASIANFTSLCEHLVGSEGQFWAMKGLFPGEELSELQKHYIVHQHHHLGVPGLDCERCLIQIRCKSARALT